MNCKGNITGSNRRLEKVAYMEINNLFSSQNIIGM
jgi:hypothetical protein